MLKPSVCSGHYHLHSRCRRQLPAPGIPLVCLQILVPFNNLTALQNAQRSRQVHLCSTSREGFPADHRFYPSQQRMLHRRLAHRIQEGSVGNACTSRREEDKTLVSVNPNLEVPLSLNEGDRIQEMPMKDCQRAIEGLISGKPRYRYVLTQDLA